MRTFTFRGGRAYVFAIVMMAAAVALTRLTWPVFSRAPFAVMFGAIYLISRFGTRRAGWLAIGVGVLGSTVASPEPGLPQFTWAAVAVFVAAAALANHLISERNQAMERLQASEEELRATWEHAALGSAILARDGRIERINPALERILGHPREAWIGGAFERFLHPEDAAGDRERFTALMAGQGASYQREERCRRRDGSWMWARVTVSSMTDGAGAITGALLVLEDITDEREAEASLRASEHKLRQAQKMEAVGQLVAGVAHNFNNLLTITMGYTDVLLESHGEQDADRPALEEIRKATSRGAALIRQLLAFSREKEAAATWVDLTRGLGDLHGIFTRAVREDIHLSIVAPTAPATVVIDQHDFEQVMLNLVINARDALPAGGHIWIDVARQRFDDPGVTSDLLLPPGDYVRVSVRDDGVGMSADVQAHLFEPFFTTKEVGEGTGMGLATVYGLVRRHHGGITVTSAPGTGTTITLYFPFVERAPQPAGAPAPAPPPTAAPVVEALRATILLVEDEDAVRAVGAHTLRRAGHRVFEASGGAEALALYDRHGNDIDLVVTDVVMPEMRGPVLAERLVAGRPELPVLFVSGYSDSGPEAMAAIAHARFLDKPFTPARLTSAVADLLADARVPVRPVPRA